MEKQLINKDDEVIIYSMIRHYVKTREMGDDYRTKVCEMADKLYPAVPDGAVDQ